VPPLALPYLHTLDTTLSPTARIFEKQSIISAPHQLCLRAGEVCLGPAPPQAQYEQSPTAANSVFYPPTPIHSPAHSTCARTDTTDQQSLTPPQQSQPALPRLYDLAHPIPRATTAPSTAKNFLLAPPSDYCWLDSTDVANLALQLTQHSSQPYNLTRVLIQLVYIVTSCTHLVSSNMLPSS